MKTSKCNNAEEKNGTNTGEGKRNNNEEEVQRWGAHQGMSLPIFVHLLFVMKKPTTGSVTAPQALPMNSTMEAWKALICRAERGQTGVKNTKLTNSFTHSQEPQTILIIFVIKLFT